MNLDRNSCCKAVQADKGPNKSPSGKMKARRGDLSVLSRFFEERICKTRSHVLVPLHHLMRFATQLWRTIHL